VYLRLGNSHSKVHHGRNSASHHKPVAFPPFFYVLLLTVCRARGRSSSAASGRLIGLHPSFGAPASVRAPQPLPNPLEYSLYDGGRHIFLLSLLASGEHFSGHIPLGSAFSPPASASCTQSRAGNARGAWNLALLRLVRSDWTRMVM
jgi:hypothetical protein